MIEFRNVSKTYDTGTKAVKNANFLIEKGEFAFLVGSSGSGKSTLIKLILKEEEPTSGHIIINGKDTTFLKPNRIPYLRRSMGVVFQDFRLLPDKTVYDNVAYAMYIVRATPRHIRRQVPMVLSLVGLSGKAKMYPNELSGGEQQRVALARALVNNPSMLIADEPTGNLDPETAWDIMNLLNDINMRGTTVVVATHAKDIVNKMKKKGYELTYKEMIENINDIAGVRIICQLKDDIFKIRNLIEELPGIQIEKEKDYVNHPKESGYSSYHMIIKIPVTLSKQTIYVKVEIQIRTMAMDFWASLEHKMKYKTDKEVNKKTSKELVNYAKIVNKMDNKIMLMNN